MSIFKKKSVDKRKIIETTQLIIFLLIFIGNHWLIENSKKTINRFVLLQKNTFIS